MNTYSKSYLLREAKGSQREALIYCRITVKASPDIRAEGRP